MVRMDQYVETADRAIMVRFGILHIPDASVPCQYSERL